MAHRQCRSEECLPLAVTCNSSGAFCSTHCTIYFMYVEFLLVCSLSRFLDILLKFFHSIGYTVKIRRNREWSESWRGVLLISSVLCGVLIVIGWGCYAQWVILENRHWQEAERLDGAVIAFAHPSKYRYISGSLCSFIVNMISA